MSKAALLDAEIEAWLDQGNKIFSIPEVKPLVYHGNAKHEMVRQLQLGDRSLDDLMAVLGDERTVLNAYKALRRQHVNIFKVGDMFSLDAPPQIQVSEFGHLRKYSERQIAKLVAGFYLNGKHLLVINNLKWSGYECDLLAVSPSMRPIEFEIKTSRQDFFADAAKEKWKKPLDIWKHYYIMPQSIYSDDLLERRACEKSGVLLIDDDNRIKEVVKAQKIANTHITAATLLNISRLLSVRHWHDQTT